MITELSANKWRGGQNNSNKEKALLANKLLTKNILSKIVELGPRYGFRHEYIRDREYYTSIEEWMKFWFWPEVISPSKGDIVMLEGRIFCLVLFSFEYNEYFKERNLVTKEYFQCTCLNFQHNLFKARCMVFTGLFQT